MPTPDHGSPIISGPREEGSKLIVLNRLTSTESDAYGRAYEWLSDEEQAKVDNIIRDRFASGAIDVDPFLDSALQKHYRNMVAGELVRKEVTTPDANTTAPDHKGRVSDKSLLRATGHKR